MIKKIFIYFSNPKKQSLLNGLLIFILIALNFYYQAFCIPTTWTIILLTISFLNTILNPLIKESRLSLISSFIDGISFFIFIYCILFLEHMNLFGIAVVFLGIGLVIFIPHFFVILIFWRNLINPVSKSARNSFLSSVLVCIALICFIGFQYKKAIDSIDVFKRNNFKVLEENFMTEKILGMHFIYHTRFCEFDGWRPPKHEPILVIGMWLNHRYDPLNINLKTRLELYKKFFPNNQYKFDCSCGIEESQTYHNDILWK